MEEWKDIKGYEGLYQISNEGRVRSLKFGKNRILKNRHCLGYWEVVLYKNGIGKPKRIHRLVAEAFIPNPQNLPCVNHKDENRSNCVAENLEWCDYKYNSNYGTRNERNRKQLTNRKDLSKQVYQYTLNGELVKKWESIREAERNGFRQNCVSLCCNGKLKTHNGYKWSYKPI